MSTNLATSQKDKKILFLLLCKGYFTKNGVIISLILENLVTLKSIVPLSTEVIDPHPKY